MTDQACILLVDDKRENLLALEAVLKPLGHRLVSVTSGEAALKELLREDVACILLDVQMPELDGYETARLIKRRDRSAHIPILFVTALSTEEHHVFSGYDAGAIDYITKPIESDILRSKVGVFVDLWRQGKQLQEQAEQLYEQELLAVASEGEERYRQLADAMPQIVWTTDAEGTTTYVNRRLQEYTGVEDDAEALHPEDLKRTRARWRASVSTGERFEAEYRLRDRTGTYRWHLGRAVPLRNEHGEIELWVGTATDIHDQKRTEEQHRFLVAAGDALSRSLDYRSTLAEVAELAVRGIADWCAVHIVEKNGTIAELAVAHEDPAQIAFARELEERYPPNPDRQTGASRVVRTGEAELVPEISDEMLEAGAIDELHLDLLRQLELRSYMCVPLKGHDRVLGAMTFISTDPGRRFGAEDLLLGEELARRAVSAIENAQLYRGVEERARAAQVLATIGDGVVLVDREGRVRLWNESAQRITGLAAPDLIGRKAAEAIPGWARIATSIQVARTDEPAPGVSVPLDAGERELWLSITAVASDEGTVYAFRDLTEERELETIRQDLVATVSHELRTPLAAIYGAAVTLRRRDQELEHDLRAKLLDVIADEAERLAEIVEDLLLTSRLDSGKLDVNIEQCDPVAIARLEIDAARTHVPETIEVELDAPAELPPVAADPAQLRQVLANLLDNAVKYSPDGGPIVIELSHGGGNVRFAVRDRGLGVPETERERIFEKFYRLDPSMSRGIGGTGLGLYICRELVRRVGGRIWVESGNGDGSTFVVEIPQGAARPASLAASGNRKEG